MNKQEFEEVYTEYKPRLTKYARTIVNERAEDAAQITLFNFWLQPDKVTHTASWLFHVCRNVCYNMNTLRYMSAEFSSEHLDREFGESAYDAAVRLEDIRELMEALNEMPTIRKSIMLQSVVAGLSADQIAKQMALSPGAVRQSLWRSRYRLRHGHEATP